MLVFREGVSAKSLVSACGRLKPLTIFFFFVCLLKTLHTPTVFNHKIELPEFFKITVCERKLRTFLET